MKIVLVLVFLNLILFTGCSADDRLTETVYLKDVVTEGIEAQSINSQNVTVNGLIAGNVTISTLILTSLPTTDPGISGMIWSDNGTLRISP